MKKALVVGFGSAGKRHANNAEMFGYEVWTADPYLTDQKVDYKTLDEALASQSFDIAVIASPPSSHLDQVKALADNGIFTLCEKPLCGFGELEKAMGMENTDRVMMAYNYRHNPALNDESGWITNSSKNWWYLKARQTRKSVPEWGFVLDHISHDLDIIRWKSGGILDIDSATHFEKNGAITTSVSGAILYGGKKASDRFEIWDIVETKIQAPRQAVLATPRGWTHITPDPQMFTLMWLAFIDFTNGLVEPMPGYGEGIKTQVALDEVDFLQQALAEYIAEADTTPFGEKNHV